MRATDIERALKRWSNWVSRGAWLIVLLSIVLALAGGYYASGHLAMQTDTEQMLSPNLPFRKLKSQFEAAFPVLDGNVAILVKGATADQAADGALALTGALRARSDLFDWVYYPAGSDFFRKNGLLFLSAADLEALSDRVAAAEPLLGALAQDMSLRGLFNVLGLAAKGIAVQGQG